MSDTVVDIDAPANYRHGMVQWQGGMVFSGRAPDGPTITMDGGDGAAGPSPVVALMLAAGSCAGIDVVMILEKMKVKLASLRVEVTGRRNTEAPKRFNRMVLRFVLSGEGLTDANVRRAVDLSVSKYCSVLMTLDPAMPVETEIVVE